MKEIKNQYALVTGATSGIGYELAKLCAQDGYNLIPVGRSGDELQRIQQDFTQQYGIKVVPMEKDLFDPNAAIDIHQEVKQQGLEVEILINDAGQGVYGLFLESDIDRQLQIIQLNISSLTVLTYLFAKDMVQRGHGRILQLASIVSEVPAPYQAVYGGTKAFVLSFTEALISELKDTGVTVTALQPGATDTDFFNKAGAQDSKLVEDKSSLADAAKVAKDGYKAMMRGDDKEVSGLKNKLQSVMSNVMPDTMLADNMKKQSEPQDK